MNQNYFKKIINNNKEVEELEKECLSIDTSKSFLFSFPDGIEKHYKKMRFQEYKKLNLIFISLGLLFFNLFAVTDKIMIKDIYHTAWYIRFFYITPIGLISLYFIKNTKKNIIMDILIINGLIQAASAILIMLYISHYYLASYYHSGIFIVAISGILVMKLSIRSKFIFTILINIINILAFYFIKTIPFESKINISFVLFALCILALSTACEYEFFLRKVFIRSLMQELGKASLEKKNKYLEIISNKDELTKLANRRFFNDYFKRLSTQKGNGIFPITILFVDIDDFKKFNDNYGHTEGDKCLKQVASVFKKYTKRKFDLAARYGGEEFIIIFTSTNHDNAFQIAEKIRKSIYDLKIPHQYSAVEEYVTISIGISIMAEDTGEMKKFIELADKALYTAKTSGKNKTVIMS